jgi:hypothetical protein
MAAEPSRQAVYNCPASRVEPLRRARTSAIRWQSSRLSLAIGARNFIARCAVISPVRTRC